MNAGILFYLYLAGVSVPLLGTNFVETPRDQRRAFYRPSSAVGDFLLSRIHSEVERKIDQMIPMKSTIYENSEPPRYFLAIPLAIFSTIAGATLLFAQPQKSPAITSKGTEAAKVEPKAEKEGNDATGVNDFDFLIGKWRVHHRRLKERLAGNHDWIEFEGTCVMQKILGGAGNMDENVLDFPGSAYRAVTLRTYDPAKGQWSIWWIDSRNPSHLDPPVVGGFKNGVGTFYADDTFKGKPIRVRFLWTNLATKPHWEQAFSDDGGTTWETNWIMEFVRIP